MTGTPEENVYIVLARKKPGAPLSEVGSVDAKSPELAKMFAKENYARRKNDPHNLYVVRESDMHEIGKDVAYGGTLEKEYREDKGYDVEGFPA